MRLSNGLFLSLACCAHSWCIGRKYWLSRSWCIWHYWITTVFLITKIVHEGYTPNKLTTFAIPHIDHWSNLFTQHRSWNCRRCAVAEIFGSIFAFHWNTKTVMRSHQALSFAVHNLKKNLVALSGRYLYCKTWRCFWQVGEVCRPISSAIVGYISKRALAVLNFE